MNHQRHAQAILQATSDGHVMKTYNIIYDIIDYIIIIIMLHIVYDIVYTISYTMYTT